MLSDHAIRLPRVPDALCALGYVLPDEPICYAQLYRIAISGEFEAFQNGNRRWYVPRRALPRIAAFLNLRERPKPPQGRVPVRWVRGLLEVLAGGGDPDVGIRGLHALDRYVGAQSTGLSGPQITAILREAAAYPRENASSDDVWEAKLLREARAGRYRYWRGY